MSQKVVIRFRWESGL